MPTEAEARASLALVTGQAAAELTSELQGVPADAARGAVLELVPLLVPDYFDAAGALAVDHYDDWRELAAPREPYSARVIGGPATDWIERELAKWSHPDPGDFDAAVAQLLNEANALVEKEVARAYRDTIIGNSNGDEAALGWSRIARPGACRMCVMLAGKGAVYRSERTAHFATHKRCHCAARPAFKGGTHGPEANVMQYVASSKRRTKGQQKALRDYLNTNYPDHRG